MTEEEKIICKSFLHDADNTHSCNEYKLLIALLGQEPTTKNSLGVDCIDRNRAIERLKLNFPISEGADDSRDRHRYMQALADLQVIRELPSVTPQEPRKGHWIGHREHCENLGVMPSGLGAYEWCSNCDCGIDVREWHRNHYNFCPNCGADMREGEVLVDDVAKIDAGLLLEHCRIISESED